MGRSETSAARKALKAAGINAQVFKGTGTSRGWILVNVGRCGGQESFAAVQAAALRIVQKATGRDDVEAGRISVNADNGFSRSRGAFEITQSGRWA